MRRTLSRRSIRSTVIHASSGVSPGDKGLVIFTVTGLSLAWGVIAMAMKLNRNPDSKERSKGSVLRSLLKVGNELATMNRYKTCDLEEDSFWKDRHWFRQPWFVHWSVMWGFIGLLGATVLDFILKDPATSIWWPSRILGTIAGLLLVYGTSLAITYRLKKVTKAYAGTRLADWAFLLFLWIAGITGFWLEVSVAFSADHMINHMVLLIHTILSMELVLLFAFSKFAHAVYRPLALFFLFRQS